MTQNNYLCETDQFILKPNNQLRQMGQLEIKRNKRFTNQTIDSEINLSGNQRTNGPVNAHLRSAAYTNKHV